MGGATILVPVPTGLSPTVAPVTSGLGTLLYMAVTGFKIPAYLGASFAFIAPIAAGAAVLVLGFVGAVAASGLRSLIEGKVDFGERRNLLIALVILHTVLSGKETAGDTGAILSGD